MIESYTRRELERMVTKFQDRMHELEAALLKISKFDSTEGYLALAALGYPSAKESQQ